MPYLSRLSITDLRNIQQSTIELSPKVNLFFGDNGSGKTSLLEAISLLGLGRSFRSHKSRSLINDQSNQLTLFAELFNHQGIKTSVGLQKSSNGRNDIRINQENAKSLTELASLLPLKIIDATAFQLLEGSSQQRRRFLDWMVFHVKPEFIGHWQRLNRALKQRNSLLRHDKINTSTIVPWDKELIELSHNIDELRRSVFTEFTEHLQLSNNTFFDDSMIITIDYHPGWDAETDFQQVLEDNYPRDCRDGYTHKGPHRADLTIKVNGKKAADVLSRGQIKSLVCMLNTASAQYYQDKKGTRLLFLVDDLLAELDKTNAIALTEQLLALDTQLFITGIDEYSLTALFDSNDFISEAERVSRFHVKRGSISLCD